MAVIKWNATQNSLYFLFKDAALMLSAWKQNTSLLSQLHCIVADAECVKEDKLDTTTMYIKSTIYSIL